MTRASGTGGLACLSALAAMSLTLGAADAQQPPAGGAAQPGQGVQPGAVVRLEDLPPSLRLGTRVSAVRGKLPVLDVLVVVPDAQSYIAAVGSWRTTARFPVLIDDGSWQAREAVVRFVRAFRPGKVVRFAAGGDAPVGDGLREAISKAMAAAWDCDDPAKLHPHFHALGLVPPGVVVAHPSDPAWTGALALAAGHGQPIVWMNASPWGVKLNEWYPLDKLEELLKSLNAEMAKLPWKWDALGDEIDAVTLCQNAPVKVSHGPPSQTSTYAVTDVLGRAPNVVSIAPTEPERTRRWAWAGQVVGNEWQAAYMAMCSLYLAPERAWLFDGYDDVPPWKAWDATAAAELFRKAGLEVAIDDGSRRGLEDWRRRAAGLAADEGGEARKDAPGAMVSSPRGVDASVVLINSSGNADFFELKPGTAAPDDLPILRRPSALHMVHSWSATVPADRNSVGGRWLERGVFAYLGSTYEPYLQSFVPTPVAAERLLYGLPFGAAVRIDNAQVWKLAVFGDPLFVLTRARERSKAELPETLRGAEVVGAKLAEQLRAGEFEQAIVSLRTVGKDEEAARLLAALLGDKPEAVTPEVALAGLGAGFVHLKPELFVKVYKAAMPRIASEPELAACKDMLWHALYGRGAQVSAEEAEMLAASMRPGCLSRDAAEAARAVQRTRGEAAARAVIEHAKSMAKDQATRDAIDRWAP